MVWFQCDDCGDSIKKPALKKHFNSSCAAENFSCVDCGQEFTRANVHLHTQCVSEHEKYALGATKPGGKAHEKQRATALLSSNEKISVGLERASDATASIVAAADDDDEQKTTAVVDGGKDDSKKTTTKDKKEKVYGEEHLSKQSPWMCACCAVTCTSEETLKEHAQGKKHKRKAKAIKSVKYLKKEKKKEKAAEQKAASILKKKRKREEEGSGEERPKTEHEIAKEAKKEEKRQKRIEKKKERTKSKLLRIQKKKLKKKESKSSTKGKTSSSAKKTPSKLKKAKKTSSAK